MPIPTDQILYNKIRDKVKRSVDRWPSAYASGMVVKEYKRQMAAKKLPPYVVETKSMIHNLTRWFKEKWIDLKTGKPCGAVKTDKYYPTCRPSVKVNKHTPVIAKQLDKKTKKSMIEQKQKAKKKRVVYKV